MERIKRILTIVLLLIAESACSAQGALSEPTLISAPTQIVEPVSTPVPGKLPLTEAGVPRVSVQDAKAALENGAAVIVDVRSPAAFEASHISGALSIPLGEIETNPTSLNLDKNQWIITYCTWYNEHTSARAAFILLQNGYVRVMPILGGFSAWIDSGYPVEP